MKIFSSRAGCLALFCSLALLAPLAHAQNKGEPGKFDFYVLNLSWSPEFCSIHGASPQCASHPGFVVHGLWPQNDDGSYPVFCSQRPGPGHPDPNLDITPDLSLLHHEWTKHGTCTNLSPEAFFCAGTQGFSIRSLSLSCSAISTATFC